MKHVLAGLTLISLALACSAAVAAPPAHSGNDDSRLLTVTYALDLDSDGRIRALEPTQPLPQDVADALEREIRNWQFEPAHVGTQAKDIRTFLRIGVEVPDSRFDRIAVLSATTGPAPEHVPAPAYPNHALRRGVNGVVVLELAVGSDGLVRKVDTFGRYDRTELPLAMAAQEAARAWRFTPERVDGRPVASTVLMPVCFVISEPTARTCEWEGPGASRFSRKAVLALEPAARLKTDIAYQP